MSPTTLSRVTAATAVEVCRTFNLTDEDRELLRDDWTPAQFLDVLLEKKHYVTAIQFLAYALPRREAIWWGCLCLRQALGPNLPPKQTEAVKGAIRWILEP